MSVAMDKIAEWFNHLLQGAIVDAMLSHFKWVDWFALSFLIIGIIYGIKQGFMRQIVEVIEMIFINCAVLHNFGRFSDYLKNHVKAIPWDKTDAVAFFSLMIVVWICVAIIDRLIRPWIHAKAIWVLKVFGGGLLGAVHFILLASFLSQGIRLIPNWGIKKSYEVGNSYTGYYMAEISPSVYEYVFHPAGMFNPVKKG